MKIVFLAIIILLFSNFCIGQIYAGKSRTGYTCMLKINSDSTIIFTGSGNDRLYVEYFGNMKKVVGNIYEITWKSGFEQTGVMSSDEKNEGYFQIGIDTLNFSKDIGFLKISYANMNQVLTSPPDRHKLFYYDKRKFNKNSILTIRTNHKNPIDRSSVVVRMPFGITTLFCRHNHEEAFRVFWANDNIESIGELPVEFDGFKLRLVK